MALTPVFGTDDVDGATLALAASTLFVMFAEHTVRVPPPLDEPLHWLIVTARPEDWV